MTSAHDELTEWTIFYVKNKDIIRKEIKDYKVLKNFVEFEYSSRKHTYYILPDLKSDSLAISKEGNITIICLNKKENLNFLVENWENFKINSKFSIIFVNIKTGGKWIVYPHTHDKITDKESLKPGLISLFENVLEV